MLYQHQQLKQQTRILPHQIQLLHLFHLNTMELEQRILLELTDNPMLEQQEEEYEPITAEQPKADDDYRDWDEYAQDDIPDYKLEYSNYFSPEETPERPISEIQCFRELAKQQFRLCHSDELKTKIADYIIDCLDDHGFLQMSVTAIADDLSFRFGQQLDEAPLLNVLGEIRQLEPFGLACSNTREFLMLQLKNMNTKRPDVKMALQLLESHYQDLMHRQLDKAMQKLHLEEDEFKIVLELIAGLQMKPVTEENTSSTPRQTIIPDFIVTRENDRLVIQLYKERSSSLYISREWISQVENMQKTDETEKAAVQYVRNKLNAARWFIQAIRQREHTMLKIMEAIANKQEDYFRDGDIKMLKPMILKNIAEEIGMDISTVSRITCNKYAETPFGTILLKDLFTEGLLNDVGEVISNKVIQHAIVEVIEHEDKKKPFTDQQLVAILSQKGFNIARRTIAKYRDLLQIPVAQMRCLWA